MLPQNSKSYAQDSIIFSQMQFFIANDAGDYKISPRKPRPALYTLCAAPHQVYPQARCIDAHRLTSGLMVVTSHGLICTGTTV